MILTIAPTLDCNMACPYCYEERQNVAMNEEVRKNIISFIKNKVEKDKMEHITVCWYGSEPTLEMNTIVELSEQIVALCDANNINYSASIVTNGYLLNREMAETLKEKCMVNRVQITIDGLEQTHNSRRILRNGDKSFATIINNIDEIKDILSINIRVNVDANNISQLEELSDFFLKEKGWKDNPMFYLAPVDVETENCKANKKECYTAAEFLSLYNHSINKIFTEGNKMVANWLYPKRMSVGCSSISNNYYVIAPDGYIYSCWNDIGNINKHTGQLTSDGLINTKEYLKWLTIEMPEKCKSCKLLPICQSGCVYKRMYAQNIPECSHRVLAYKDNLKLAYELYLQEKQQVI